MPNIKGRTSRNTRPFRRPSHKCPAPGTAQAAAQIKKAFVECARTEALAGTGAVYPNSLMLNFDANAAD